MCTIQNATGICGKPAVTTFTGRDGTVYAECAEHDMSGTAASAVVASIPRGIMVGDHVTVCHIGIEKHGVVTWVGRSRCHVEVTVAAGRRDERRKVIARAIADVR